MLELVHSSATPTTPAYPPRNPGLTEIAGRWYALQIQTQSPAPVLEGLRFHGIQTFHPTYKQTAKRKYRPDLEKPLFPGYVFVRMNLENLDLRHRAVSVPGVIRFVGYGDQPVAITAQEIEGIRRVMEAPAAVPAPRVEGETVRVTRGPLAGMEGVVALVKGKTRLVVSIGLLNRGVSTEVDAAWLESTPPLKKAA